MFIKKLAGEIKCIANTEEEYVSFSKHIVIDTYTEKDGIGREIKVELRFLDSFRFMGSSLDSLVKNLNKDQFRNLGKFYIGR